ncbi:DUF262 domain-containing protein [Helicobacter sp. NHP21005]|uniref:DUF262 domain-containing protein n=1 Tax=Helicobacter felistomachi TaxID=3040201 RepID=UPI00257280FC|nr:DUF262 domain-containing HNH endonuclease family protein [Helicobacter sp. NHP21005]BEG57038.1 DUF262 domain-containing protein [Helicobacter sp. NHP21005]
MAEMKTEQKSVLDYLSKNEFLIPEYQRPYAWDEEQCTQLWDDLEDFFDEKEGQAEYFLGPVVMYKQNGAQHIIDGQQRTTTLILLLKALYNKAYKDKSEETSNLVSMLESYLWDRDDISGKPDYQKTRLKSEVATDAQVEVLEAILNNTYAIPEKVDPKASLYEKNYCFFLGKSDDFARERPTQWNRFCVTLLKSCVLLPIECEGASEDKKLENALRIFNTLNNRGLPLSDADMFKSIIFKNKEGLEEKSEFVQMWKELEEHNDSSLVNGLDNFFRHYMHVVRAREQDKSKEKNLRDFFLKKHKKILEDKSVKVMEEIKRLKDFWATKPADKRAQQFYDVLCFSPNEYWKYLNSTYCMHCQEHGQNYEEGLAHFFARMITHICVKFIAQPTVNTTKILIFNAYTSLYNKDKENKLDFQTDTAQILDNETLFRAQFFKANKLIPALLRLYLYVKYPAQEPFLPGQIEHIFPRTTKWQPGYTGWNSKKEAEPFIESIGNKMWLTQRENIQAGNNYFDVKKKKYQKSKYLEAQALAKLKQDDWLKADIEARNEDIYQTLRKFFLENL